MGGPHAAMAAERDPGIYLVVVPGGGGLVVCRSGARCFRAMERVVRARAGLEGGWRRVRWGCGGGSGRVGVREEKVEVGWEKGGLVVMGLCGGERTCA